MLKIGCFAVVEAWARGLSTKWLFVLGQFSSLGYMHSNNGRDSCELFISEAKINGVSLGWLLIFVVVGLS